MGIYLNIAFFDIIAIITNSMDPIIKTINPDEYKNKLINIDSIL